MATNFYNDEKLTDAQSLRSVVFCYLHEKDSITDYKVAGESLNIPVFSFGENRIIDMVTWKQ